MKRNTATILVTSISALFIIFFLLVNLTEPVSLAPSVPAKKEISIDLIIEKKKVKISKPKSIKPKPIKPKIKKGKAPSSSTSLKEGVLNGALPPISANYREHLGFKRYANAMHARGARFYILGSSRKQIYEINFSSRSLSSVSAANIINKNFSPRTRIIEDEPALQFFHDKARNDFRIASPRVILLVPQQMEQKIASRLFSRGINVNKFCGFRGVYLISSGNFILNIHEGVSKSGKQSMNVAIPL
jgi:hypothetical protein